MTVFGKHLTSKREDKNLTQRKVAKAVGVSQPAYQAWESGKTMPTIKNLCLLQEVLGLNGQHCLSLMVEDVTPKQEERACIECDTLYVGDIYCPSCEQPSGETLE